MKFLSSLIVTFIAACIGWTLLPVGLLILVACFLFAYVMSIHLVFGSIRNFTDYLEEMSQWAQTMIP